MLLDKIKACVLGYRHTDYEHTKQKAVFYQQILTGEKQEKLIVSYKERESDAQKEQRIRLYHGRTKDVCNRIAAQIDKVATVEHRSELSYTQPNTAASDKIASAVSSYSTKEPATLQQYLFAKLKYYTLADPNAWLVNSYLVQQDGTVVSYPIEFKSQNAADYNYLFGVLEYFIGFDEWLVKSEGETKTVKAWFGYEAGKQMFCIQALSGVSADMDYLNAIQNAVSVQIGDETYFVVETITPTKETEAMRFGYIPDYSTDSRTFVSLTDVASEQFKDLINRKSEYDLSLALHTFLQKFQVAETCNYVPENQPADRCDGGRLRGSGKECPSCKGAGIKIHTTSQDIVFVKRVGKNEETYIPLTEMARYVEMPFDIVKHQSENVDKLPREISISVFGVDVNTRPTGSPTATEIRNHYDSLYSVLYQFAQKLSQMWVFSAKRIAEQQGVDANFAPTHEYPKDFDLMSEAELLTMLKLAKDSGAPYPIIEGYENKIIEKQHPDNPALAQLIKEKRKFLPFKGLSEQTVLNHIATLPSTDRNKVLYLYSDLVFANVIKHAPDFMLMPFDKQKSIVDAELTKFIEENRQQPPTLNDFPNE